MPAYRAEKTLARCHAAIPYDIVDEVLLVDDASDDATIAVAEQLGITVSPTPIIAVTAPVKRPVMRRRWPAAPTSS